MAAKFPVKFSFEVDGKVEFKRSFNRFEKQIDDLRFVWDSVYRWFLERNREQFAKEGSTGESGAWQPLSRRYAEWKQKHFPFKKILRRTDRLYRSLIAKGDENVFNPQPQFVELGTVVPYAVFHQRGTKKMPARPLISWTEKDRVKLMKVIQKELVAAIRKETGFALNDSTASTSAN